MGFWPDEAGAESSLGDDGERKTEGEQYLGQIYSLHPGDCIYWLVGELVLVQIQALGGSMPLYLPAMCTSPLSQRPLSFTI